MLMFKWPLKLIKATVAFSQLAEGMLPDVTPLLARCYTTSCSCYTTIKINLYYIEMN